MTIKPMTTKRTANHDSAWKCLEDADLATFAGGAKVKAPSKSGAQLKYLEIKLKEVIISG